MKLLLKTLLLLATITSCTVVTTSNVPGEQLAEFPKKWIGTYELGYPSDFQALDDGAVKTRIEIQKNQLIASTTTGDNSAQIGDSMYVSKLGKYYYLSVGAAPAITVFRVIRDGKNLKLYGMFCNDGVTESDLAAYFSNVGSVAGEMDESGEQGPTTYQVMIDEKKLDAFFASPLPYKEPFVLQRVSN